MPPNPPNLRIVHPDEPVKPSPSIVWPVAMVACLVGVAFLVMVLSSRPAPDAIGWLVSFDTAAAQAASTGKMILLDFSADWCPPCQVMNDDVFSSPAVGETIRAAFIPVRVDMTHRTGKSAELADYFNIEGYPTFVALDSAGREVSRQVGAMSQDRFLLWLAQVQPQPPSPAQLSATPTP